MIAEGSQSKCPIEATGQLHSLSDLAPEVTQGSFCHDSVITTVIKAHQVQGEGTETLSLDRKSVKAFADIF